MSPTMNCQCRGKLEYTAEYQSQRLRKELLPISIVMEGGRPNVLHSVQDWGSFNVSD